MTKPNVFISYNWGSEKVANDIENRLTPFADVCRDKSSLLHWQIITEFMKTIRKSDLAVLIVSDLYLKSVTCLYEIMQLLKEDNWADHTMFVVEEDAVGIYKTINQLNYVQYWQEEYDNLDAALKKYDCAATTKQAEELRKIDLIKLHICEFLQVVADRKNPEVDLAIEEIERRVREEYKQLNMENEKDMNDEDDFHNPLFNQQPIFDIKILAVNKQIPGVVDVFDLWGTAKLPEHRNLQLSFELANDVVVRNAILFGKHIDTLIEPHKKYKLIIAFEDSPDAKRAAKYVTMIKHEDYSEQGGYPEEFKVVYEDRYGYEQNQTFELCNKGEIKYYGIKSEF
ncbi:MAG: toll/interleukin-1 receptor domain-containing protein [Acetatifactor sp.]|nr:toll/interleukin-1 receptor domain-containing protein [Acetatifactor sp.]